MGDKQIKRIGFLVDALDLNFQNQVLQGTNDECKKSENALIVYVGVLQYEHNEKKSQYFFSCKSQDIIRTVRIGRLS